MVKDWMNKNVNENVSNNLSVLVSNIVFLIWSSPYRIITPLLRYLNNKQFRKVMILTWFVLCFSVIIIITILMIVDINFNPLEWYIGILMGSLLLIVLSKVIKITKIDTSEIVTERETVINNKSISSLNNDEDEEELPSDEEELPLDNEELPLDNEERTEVEEESNDFKIDINDSKDLDNLEEEQILATYNLQEQLNEIVKNNGLDDF